ncbi:DUF6221 family protein [Streptomyces sp. NBC_00334]|uniref:DUF6221 family protein n=1 Tax=Streptomyces sp. NBC_00334 TaxID=2975713 RepID=UPI002E2C33DD|nr:DUF6221 family protein [Streptomyces sp. NBC_00334]
MDELVQWLRVQIAQDERIARAAGGAAWEELPVSGWVHTSALPDTEWLPPGYDHHVASAPLPVDRAHIVEHDPARVLREIDAKRQIVALHSDPRGGDPSCSSLDYPENAEDCETLRALALPYADRPGYRDDWRP